MAEHRATYTHTCSGNKFTAVCSCGWWSCEWDDEERAREHADMHERGELQPWEADEVKVWDPQDRPFPGT